MAGEAAAKNESASNSAEKMRVMLFQIKNKSVSNGATIDQYPAPRYAEGASATGDPKQKRRTGPSLFARPLQLPIALPESAAIQRFPSLTCVRSQE